MNRALAELLRRFPAAAEFTSEILKLLAMLETGGRAGHATLDPTGESSAYRRGEGVAGYSIDHGRHGDVLVEKRHGNSKDFRCPQDVYRATVQVVADSADGGVPFEDILAAVTKRLGYRPAEYLSRICIRFWLSRKPPLLLRARSRYKPIEPTKFVRQAERAWRDPA